MSVQIAFVRFPGGFRVDRIDQIIGDEDCMFDILCEQPVGTLASALMESADVITVADAQQYLSADDIAYYMALADQQERRDI